MNAVMRLFVGLPLPDACLEALEVQAGHLRRRLVSRCSWPRPGNRHVTLRFLGETPAARLSDVRRALEGVSWRGFGARLGGAGAFPSPRRPVVVHVGLARGAEACSELHRAVQAALEPLGFTPEARAFVAHVTLCRVKTPAPGEDWDAALGLLAEAAWPDFPVERFVLWRSVLGGAGGGAPGPEYVPLGEYPAAGQAETSGPG